MTSNVRRRDRNAVLEALRAGLPPTRGIHHVQVGREQELQAVHEQLLDVKDGGACIRFVVGEYGAGKSFFLHVVRRLAHGNGFVTVNGTLSPERRLQGGQGRARALYREVVASCATKTQPHGQALPEVVEQVLVRARRQAAEKGLPLQRVLRDRLDAVQGQVRGDVSTVLQAYWRGHEQDDAALQQAALRWLRGDYATRTDARRDGLAVGAVLGDQDFLDSFEMFAAVVRLAGYSGVLVMLDELDVLRRLTTPARNANLEALLTLVNRYASGAVSHVALVVAATPEVVEDDRRGLYANAALRSRLDDGAVSAHGLQDLRGILLRLAPLTRADLVALLDRIRTVHGSNGNPCRLPDEGIERFVTVAEGVWGDTTFLQPRRTVRQFVSYLDVLHDHPRQRWDLVLEGRRGTLAAAPDGQDPPRAEAAESADVGDVEEVAEWADASATRGVPEQADGTGRARELAHFTL